MAQKRRYHRPNSGHCHCLWNCCMTTLISSNHFRYPEFLQYIRLEGCQAGYTRSTEETTDSQPQPQTHHIALCLVAYLIVEHERFERRMTWRQFKRHLILKKPHTPLPALERLRMAA